MSSKPIVFWCSAAILALDLIFLCYALIDLFFIRPRLGDGVSGNPTIDIVDRTSSWTYATGTWRPAPGFGSPLRNRFLAGLMILIAVAVGAGRFTIPGHDLRGWPGAYEAFAHIWIGWLAHAWWLRKYYARGKLAGWLLLALTILEIVMFINRAGH